MNSTNRTIAGAAAAAVLALAGFSPAFGQTVTDSKPARPATRCRGADILVVGAGAAGLAAALAHQAPGRGAANGTGR